MISVMQQYHETVAEGMQHSFDFELEVDPGWGIRVKTMPHASYYLCKMLHNNWRLIEVLPEDHMSSSRSWCYGGDTPRQALIAALTYGVIAWDGAEGTEPSGWIKSLPDERRGPGRYGWDQASE